MQRLRFLAYDVLRRRWISRRPRSDWLGQPLSLA